VSLSVLSIASEAYPLVKTGGLADVAGALPGALAVQDIAVTTLLPGYPSVLGRLKDGVELYRWPELFGAAARLLRGGADGLDLLVLDAPELYARDGLYTDRAGRDWPDNWRRFAALGRIGADLALGRIPGVQADLLHAHDWQAALAPAYLRYAEDAAPPSVLTVHNLAFQGWFDASIFPRLGFPDPAFDVDGVEHNGGVGFLKAGLRAADVLTTVSPTYAEEICTPAFGMGLDGLLRSRRDRLHGIVNGVDVDVWSPSADPHLAAPYAERSLKRRAVNRAAVEVAFGLEPGAGPLYCVVSRLTWQKGMDVLLAAVDELVATGARLALLGSGEAELERGFQQAAARHPARIGVRLGYDEALSHLLQGGADAILIPSRFEPCGLTQLYGLRYGCLPVAARTGGLADTIVDANAAAVAAGAATGVLFDPVTPEGLTRALARTAALHRDPAVWRRLQTRAMRTDVSWTTSAAAYADLYRRVASLSR
jgi:starch synthase